jgi:glycosyltransferase involved in cell wall biosynthesis
MQGGTRLLMRILHIITTINRGGAENQLLTLASHQVHAGHDVYVLPLKGNLALKDAFEANSVRVIDEFANISWVIQLIKIKKYLLRNAYEAVHGHLPRAEITTALACDSKKFVVTRHNSESFFPGAPQILSNLLSKYVEKKAFRVICISSAVNKFLCEKGEVINETELIYYGRDSSTEVHRDIQQRKNFLTRLNISCEAKIVSTLSRLTAQKDLITLLNAFSEVNNKMPLTHLLVGGSGELLDILKSHAAQLKISNNVTWLGQVQNTQEIYNATDVFVLTSIYEGFGLVLLEAMSFHIPVVASNNTSIPEVLGKDHPGLTKTGDVPAFTQNILDFLQPASAKRAVFFQDKRLELFDIDVTVRKHDSIYKLLR